MESVEPVEPMIYDTITVLQPGMEAMEIGREGEQDVEGDDSLSSVGSERHLELPVDSEDTDSEADELM
jgi:hypothetical protein